MALHLTTISSYTRDVQELTDSNNHMQAVLVQARYLIAKYKSLNNTAKESTITELLKDLESIKDEHTAIGYMTERMLFERGIIQSIFYSHYSTLELELFKEAL